MCSSVLKQLHIAKMTTILLVAFLLNLILLNHAVNAVSMKFGVFMLLFGLAKYNLICIKSMSIVQIYSRSYLNPNLFNSEFSNYI